jgi:RNA recognition motif-containing protein
MEDSAMGRKLYVGNISHETGERELQALFARVGTVARVTIMRDLATGRARGFAFVEMHTDAEAKRAIRELNDYEFGGRDLAVNEARPKTAPERDVTSGGVQRARSEQRKGERRR